MRGCKRLKNINSVSGKLGERHLDPKRRFLIVRFAVAKYFIVLGQEGRQLSRILRIGDSQ
jgi:hypothetical protein